MILAVTKWRKFHEILVMFIKDRIVIYYRSKRLIFEANLWYNIFIIKRGQMFSIFEHDIQKSVYREIL